MKLRKFIASLAAAFGFTRLSFARKPVEPFLFDPKYKTYGDFWMAEASKFDSDWACVMEAVGSPEQQAHVYGFCAKRNCQICLPHLRFTVEPHEKVVFKPEAIEAAKRILDSCY